MISEELMSKVWEAYQGDPMDPKNNTEAGLKRVVEVVMEHASTPSPESQMVGSDLLKDAYLEGWQDASSADHHERDREHAEAGWDFSDAKRSSPEPATNAKTLEEIKYLTLTAGAPNYMPTPDALRRILWLCRQAGVTKTLDELGEYAQGCTTPPQSREVGNNS